MFCLPVLSAQFITAPTGRPSEMRNLAPADPPRPKIQNERHEVIYQDHKTWLPDACPITACCMLQGFYLISQQPLYVVNTNTINVQYHLTSCGCCLKLMVRMNNKVAFKFKINDSGVMEPLWDAA